ncbi:unnamed protein product [Meloidogyne enterolobii]|uniref:Uncharacterized protein n=1 Tax=Meloidogyne enterolobii TaxID=390850 RepID=A0ACB0Y652_MELEN
MLYIWHLHRKRFLLYLSLSLLPVGAVYNVRVLLSLLDLLLLLLSPMLSVV